MIVEPVAVVVAAVVVDLGRGVDRHLAEILEEQKTLHHWRPRWADPFYPWRHHSNSLLAVWSPQQAFAEKSVLFVVAFVVELRVLRGNCSLVVVDSAAEMVAFVEPVVSQNGPWDRSIQHGPSLHSVVVVAATGADVVLFCEWPTKLFPRSWRRFDSPSP